MPNKMKGVRLRNKPIIKCAAGTYASHRVGHREPPSVKWAVRLASRRGETIYTAMDKRILVRRAATTW